MLATLLFGFIVCVPFIPHCSDWSLFNWNVLSSWKDTTVFDFHLSVGVSTLGRAFIASLVGALVLCRKLIFTILWRNNLAVLNHIWPLMQTKNLFRMQRLVQCRLLRYWHWRWEKGLWMVSSFRRCNHFPGRYPAVEGCASLWLHCTEKYSSCTTSRLKRLAIGSLMSHVNTNFETGLFCTWQTVFFSGLMTFNE